MAVDKSIRFKPSYLVDETGKRTGVVLSIEEFEALMELVEDYNDAIAGDKAVANSTQLETLDEVEAEFRRDGLL